jgi:hypothetical protein
MIPTARILRLLPFITLVNAAVWMGALSTRAQTFSITNFTLGPTGVRTLQFPTDTNSYYILYAGAVVTNINQPIAINLGASGTLQFQDPSPQLAAQFYRVRQVPLNLPLDTDGDGMDDVFELNYPGCLNPLDPSDATVDCDGDGRSNLQEYYDGTNPILADALPRLVINEVDYDTVGTDTTEFLELLNKGTNIVNLSHYAAVFINGNDNLEYSRVALNGTLGAGQYLVMASTNLTGIAPGARVIRFVSGDNNIQNGAPDGIALVNLGRTIIMDSFAYEGGMFAATINGFPGTYNLVHGTALPTSVADSNAINGSLARLPNGQTSGDDSADWVFSGNPTPGATNLP